MSGVVQDSLSVETLYSEYHGWLHQVLRRRLGNTDDAADLAHDAFIRLLTKPRHLSQHTARAYLSRMARGLCIDLWRRREIEQAWLDTLAHHPDQEAPSAEQQTAAMEALIEVDAMLRRLPEPVADAFLQSMVHGLTGREIAQRLNVSERTVRNYLSKAMLACLRLQARLEGETLTATANGDPDGRP